MLWSKRLWAVVLVGVLVAGLLVGFGAGGEAVAKEPRATLRKVMIPAAAFIPTQDALDYDNDGFMLSVVSGDGMFAAPLWFPVPEVIIRKITLIAFDNSAAGRICVDLYRAEPLRADDWYAGAVCTADSTDDPQRTVTTALSHRRVNTVNIGPYLWADIGAPNMSLYGVQVVYSY